LSYLLFSIATHLITLMLNLISSASMLVFTVLISSVSAFSCTWASENPKATFDLSSLIMTEPKHYRAEDTYAGASRPFWYYFNICEDVEEPETNPPTICENLKNAAAYQVINETEHNSAACVELGKITEYKWDLIDGDNALMGVSLTYMNGKKCKSGKARSFKVNFKCTKLATSLPMMGVVVEEGCDYSVDIETIHACPLECHMTSHEHLCSNHGLCSIDITPEINGARCFCNEGKQGDVCDQEYKVKGSSTNVTGILIGFVIGLLILLMGLSVVLYIKIKALNADTNPYGAFEDQEPVTAAQ